VRRERNPRSISRVEEEGGGGKSQERRHGPRRRGASEPGQREGRGRPRGATGVVVQ
jgi:hypothetical protein